MRRRCYSTLVGSKSTAVHTDYRGTKRATRVVLSEVSALGIPKGPDTQTLDDKPPAARCAWGARHLCAELCPGWSVLLYCAAPGLAEVRAFMSTP
jgi:hypothetical protein